MFVVACGWRCSKIHDHIVGISNSTYVLSHWVVLKIVHLALQISHFNFPNSKLGTKEKRGEGNANKSRGQSEDYHNLLYKYTCHISLKYTYPIMEIDHTSHAHLIAAIEGL